jgi:Nucleotidyl transferase AbiEii toxin, Type IV TA system
LNRPSNWQALLAIARELIGQVNSDGAVIDRWTLGGGTALMLQIDHRESYDIDIFLDDPQLLGFLDPAKNDFRMALAPDNISGDGLRFQKFSFAGIGEIDFIAAGPLTKDKAVSRMIKGRKVELETVAEIIAKKVHFRGRSIQPRDIFDIAAAVQNHSAEISAALGGFEADVGTALDTMKALNPAFVEAAIERLATKPGFSGLAHRALGISIDFLGRLKRAA